MDIKYRVVDFVLAHHRSIEDLLTGKNTDEDLWIQLNFKSYGVSLGLGTYRPDSIMEEWECYRSVFIQICEIVFTDIVQRLDYIELGVYWGKYQYQEVEYHKGDSIGERIAKQNQYLYRLFNHPDSIFYEPKNRHKPITANQINYGIRRLRERSVGVLFGPKIKPAALEKYIETFAPGHLHFRAKKIPS